MKNIEDICQEAVDNLEACAIGGLIKCEVCGDICRIKNANDDLITCQKCGAKYYPGPPYAVKINKVLEDFADIVLALDDQGDYKGVCAEYRRQGYSVYVDTACEVVLVLGDNENTYQTLSRNAVQAINEYFGGLYDNGSI